LPEKTYVAAPGVGYKHLEGKGDLDAEGVDSLFVSMLVFVSCKADGKGLG
jgi:hypothetical protein